MDLALFKIQVPGIGLAKPRYYPFNSRVAFCLLSLWTKGFKNTSYENQKYIRINRNYTRNGINFVRFLYSFLGKKFILDFDLSPSERKTDYRGHTIFSLDRWNFLDCWWDKKSNYKCLKAGLKYNSNTSLKVEPF